MLVKPLDAELVSVLVGVLASVSVIVTRTRVSIDVLPAASPPPNAVATFTLKRTRAKFHHNRIRGSGHDLGCTDCANGDRAFALTFLFAEEVYLLARATSERALGKPVTLPEQRMTCTITREDFGWLAAHAKCAVGLLLEGDLRVPTL